MSLIGDIIAGAVLIASPVRMIGYIIPDCTIEELHSDDLAVTDHPVEIGAAISDHAFKIPSRLEMRIGFSDATAGTSGYVQQVYQQLLSLQAAREPFDVYTGKRLYNNMLLGRIAIETNEQSEYALMVVAGLREVLISYTQQTSASASSQANPEKTGSVTQGGTVNPLLVGPSGEGTIPGIVSPNLSIGISPNAVGFGAGTFPFTGGIGATPSGGGFGLGGPVGASPY